MKTRGSAVMGIVGGALVASRGALPQSNLTLQGVIDGGVTDVNNQHGAATALFDSGILSPDVLTLNLSKWTTAYVEAS